MTILMQTSAQLPKQLRGDYDCCPSRRYAQWPSRQSGATAQLLGSQQTCELLLKTPPPYDYMPSSRNPPDSLAASSPVEKGSGNMFVFYGWVFPPLDRVSALPFSGLV